MMHTGFSVRAAGGAVSLEPRTTPASWRLVSTSRRGACQLILFGRLHYRDELHRRLGGLAALPPANESDASLALHWFLASGVQGLEHLEGEYALAVWEAEAQTLVLARDPHGCFPLYYCTQGEGLAADTSLPALRSDSTAWDREFLADCLTVGGSVSELPTERTAWAGIQRVRPGTAVTFHEGTIRTRRFWSWADGVEQVEARDTPSLIEEVRSRLAAAVRERIEETTSCHLSGGLDSTAITFLAAQLLASAERPVHAVSVAYRALGSLKAEGPYLEAALRGRSDIVSHLVDGDELLDFDDFATSPLTDEPYPGLWRLPMDRATLQAAQAAGAQVLMTGIGGDELFEAFPYHLADLIRRGRWPSAWRDATRWAEHLHLNAWDVLYPFGIVNAWPVWTRLGFGGSFFPRGDLSRANEWLLPDWLLPGFANRYDMRGRIAAALRAQYRGQGNTALSQAVNTIEKRAGNVPGWLFGIDHGLTVTHPILDRRVTRLALGAVACSPQREPDGMKPLLRKAVEQLLPPEIVKRRTKGHFNELFYRGLGRNLPELERLVRSPAVAALEMIDPDRFMATLRKASGGGLGMRPLHFAITALTVMRWVAGQDVMRCPCSA